MAECVKSAISKTRLSETQNVNEPEKVQIYKLIYLNFFEKNFNFQKNLDESEISEKIEESYSILGDIQLFLSQRKEETFDDTELVDCV